MTQDCTLGLALGYGMMRGLKLLVPAGYLPQEADISIDVNILVFWLAVSILTAIPFGLAPALHAARVDPGRFHERRRTLGNQVEADARVFAVRSL